MKTNSKPHGEQGFDLYYREIYGKRWEQLRAALQVPAKTVPLSDRLMTPYYMDSASITAAASLPVHEGSKVLDMCAAPGGKTLSIALRLNGSGVLISNDRSAARRQRLCHVIENCLDDQLRKPVEVTGHDSTKWGLYQKNEFDCVLLDAPCSSERHVIQNPAELSKWSPGRPKALSVKQFAMLAAALDAVKVGGYILYSTCSINPTENWMVIDKLFRKRINMVEYVTSSWYDYGEKTEYGCIILPDSCKGAGPLYFCLLRRIK